MKLNPQLFAVLKLLAFSGLLSWMTLSIALAGGGCTKPEHHAFDFWIGDWEVKDTDNKVVGHNLVEPVLGGCALSENWSGSTGHQGKSYNFYDSRRGLWHQTWIDFNGGALYLDGGMKSGKMVLSGTGKNAKGQPIVHEISYKLLDDGRVRQHWRISEDDGNTWKDAFLGFYSKKGE